MSVFFRSLIATWLFVSTTAAAAKENITYSYDAQGRLIQVSHSGAISEGARATYKYDRATNRTNVNVITSWTSPAKHSGDFNGDGYGDALWRNVDGTVTDWLGQSNGTLPGNGDNFSTVISSDWHISSIGDFNGDGKADLLWRNDDGTVTDWLGQPNGSLLGNGSNFATGVSGDWKIVGTGDFNGDGKADILWRNDNGYVSEWLGNSLGAFADNGGIAGTGAADNTWHVVGVGDFNGDGRDDILWRNDNGTVAEWLGNANGSFTSNANVSSSVDATWKIIGVGDFNCDRRADILWRNDNGDLTQWQATSTGTFITSPTPYYHVATNLRVALIGDFNGDRCDDLLWRDTAGNVSQWLGGSGGAFTNNAPASYGISTDWNIEPR